MQKIIAFCAFYATVFIGVSQINSSSPTKPFGSNTSYQYGLMPTNLPTSGTYGASQKAADAYTAWKTKFVENCSVGSRVKFDTETETVSEGIAYGMLLSVYAGDKPLFDNLWKYYKANSNSNGVMNWKINGCSGTLGYNGATDAELDAAMALIIASEQWPSATSPYTYITEAKTLIKAIRTKEIHQTTYQTLNGDAWGSSNTCRNPSYFSPAYYRLYASVDVLYSDFWDNTVATSQSFLLTNRNATTGLVGNWANTSGVSNNCNGPNEFGFDAIRNPWRMAVDVLWHGSTQASTASDICEKMADWILGHESAIKIPLAQTAVDPTVGLYSNGTSHMASLAIMGASANHQTSLNTCYTKVASGFGTESYFNATLRCITLFVLTGNFWKPESISTDITEQLETGITVYPSICDNMCTVESKSIISKVSVTNMLGDKVFETNVGANSVQIPLESLMSGGYFVTVYSNNQTFVTHRIIKK